MADYIEREAALSLCGWYNTVNGKSICAARKDELASLPAADVVEVKRGRWETIMVAPAGELVRWTHAHQEGGYLYTDLRTQGHNFCPNCGCQMVGDENGRD